MTTLHLIVKDTYIDQYGYEHECWRVEDSVEVERTTRFESYEYYTETIKDWFWKAVDDDDPRIWRCHTQTDFGGSASWSPRDPETLEHAEPHNFDKRWIRDSRKPDAKGKPHWHGSKPVIFPEEEYD